MRLPRLKIRDGALLILLAIAQPSYSLSPKHIDGATTINSSQAKKLWIKGVKFLDVRKDTGGWVQGRIPDAIHIDIKKRDFNENNIEKYISKDEPVVVYCNAEKCYRSSNASKQLIKWGWKKVYYFRGGFPSWKSDNNPYE